MKIVNYKKFNEISPTSKCMIFCTCAESNQKHYLDKIKIWFERYKNFNADFKRVIGFLNFAIDFIFFYNNFFLTFALQSTSNKILLTNLKN